MFSRILLLVAVVGLWEIGSAESIANIDPVRNLCQMLNHMATIYDNKFYTVGGSAYYRVNENDLFSIESDESGVYLMKSCNGFLRSIDLTQPFDASTDDPSVAVGELPAEIPLVKRGALWGSDSKLYLWGGELEVEQVYRNGEVVNETRPFPDGDIWEYDIASSEWSRLNLASGSPTVSSPSYGNPLFVEGSSTNYYVGGTITRSNIYSADGSLAANSTEPVVRLSTMAAFNVSTSTWANYSLPSALEMIRAGAMVYFEGIGDEGILVSVGGERYDGNTHNYVPMNEVYVYDIANREWYVQETTSDTGFMPESRIEHCATGIMSEDGTSYNIYIYGGIPSSWNDDPPTSNTLDDTWILSLPSFKWISTGVSGGFVGGRLGMVCGLVNNKYLLAHRGRTGQAINVCDSDSGLWLFDLENLNWTRSYEPPETNHIWQVPKKISNVIGGDATGKATLLAPNGGFTSNLEAVFAKNASTSVSSSTASSETTTASSSDSGDSSSSNAGAIAGGTIAGVAVLGLLAGFFFWKRRKAAHAENDTSNNIENQHSMSGKYSAYYEMDLQPAVHEMDTGDASRMQLVEAPGSSPGRSG